MTINDRFSRLIDFLELTSASFSKAIGVSPTVIHNIIKGRKSSPSFEVISKVLKKYPSIDSDWLILGEGKILKREYNNQLINVNEEKDSHPLSNLNSNLLKSTTFQQETNELRAAINYLSNYHIFHINKLFEKDPELKEIYEKILSTEKLLASLDDYLSIYYNSLYDVFKQLSLKVHNDIFDVKKFIKERDVQIFTAKHAYSMLFTTIANLYEELEGEAAMKEEKA